MGDVVQPTLYQKIYVFVLFLCLFVYLSFVCLFILKNFATDPGKSDIPRIFIVIFYRFDLYDVIVTSHTEFDDVYFG